MERYFGCYQRFETVSEKGAGYLLNADNLVGDQFGISIVFEEGKRVAWLENKFGRRIGYFEEGFSRQLSLLEAQGKHTFALLSYIAYTEEENGGRYWGEMAIVSFDARLAEHFELLLAWLAGRLREGVRPRIDFDRGAVDKIINSGGTWRPDQTLPLAKLPKGSVIMKDKLSIEDRFIEKGRQGNIGCYIVSWAFLIVLLVGLLFLGKTLLGM